MPKFKARSGEIYFEHRGARANPRVLLIHGLGCQLVQWPESFVRGLVDSGLCAVLFDNRDAGLSHGPEGPPPSLEALLAANDAVTPDYTLSDMAQDAVDLLDHLGQGGAHVVGLSMGGMIAQRMAIEHPKRVYSLTSIMSSTGNPDLPAPAPDAMAAALALTEDNAETAVAHHIHAWRVWGGGHFDSRECGIAQFAERAVERAFRPHGIVRQYAAIVADGDRTEALGQLAAPEPRRPRRGRSAGPGRRRPRHGRVPFRTRSTSRSKTSATTCRNLRSRRSSTPSRRTCGKSRSAAEADTRPRYGGRRQLVPVSPT